MPQGFQAWDASGNLITDLTFRVAKVLGTFSIGFSHTGAATSGSVNNTNLTAYAGMTPWWAVVNGGFTEIGTHPEFSVSGNNINWNFPVATERPDTTVIYGIY